LEQISPLQRQQGMSTAPPSERAAWFEALAETTDEATALVELAEAADGLWFEKAKPGSPAEPPPPRQAALLQKDLFSGEWVEVYPRPPGEQLGLWSAHKFKELSEQRATRPWLTDRAKGTLELERIDLRTPEAIEQELQREAEKLTSGLFPTEAAPAVAMTLDPTPTANEAAEQGLLIDTPSPPIDTFNQTDEDEADAPPVLAGLSPYVTYMELIRLAEEEAATLAATPVMQLSQAIALNMAKLDARSAGLTQAEIRAAVTIGTFRGCAAVQTIPKRPEKPVTSMVAAPGEAPEQPLPSSDADQRSASMPQVAALVQMALMTVFSPETKAKRRPPQRTPPAGDPVTFSQGRVREWWSKPRAGGEYGGVWLAALRFWVEQVCRWVERETLSAAYPVLSVSKAHLLAARPDLKDAITALDDEAMGQIAKMMADMLHKEYLTALALTLDGRYTGRFPPTHLLTTDV
jgi:hypothetical protein